LARRSELVDADARRAATENSGGEQNERERDPA
jgi:hypothetical protein